MKMYNASASLTIPLRVAYTCSYCDHETVDEEQKLSLSGQSHGSMMPSEKLNNEARENLMDGYHSIMEDVSNGRFHHAYLNCTCPSCGKRQIWASYQKQTNWSFILFLLGMAMIIFLIANRDEITLAPTAAIFPAMMVPFFVILIKNKIIDRKVSALDKRYLPVITRKIQ